MSLVRFNYNKYRIFHIGLCVAPPPYNAMQKAFIKNSLEYIELNPSDPDVNKKAVAMAEAFRPDIVFIQVQNDGIINLDTVKKIKKTGAWVCNWTGDVRSPIPIFYKTLGRHIDITLFTNMTDVLSLRREGINADYLEIGIDENIFTPNGKKTKSPPIVFMGNNYGPTTFPMSKYRIDMVAYMKEKFREKFGVYGGNWENANGDLNSSQTDEASVYRGCKIAISLSHFEYIRYSSDRLLRILGVGTPICLAKSYPNVEIDFTDGVHLRTWNNMYELETLCKYYLNEENEKERQEIASNGHRLIHENFTFDKMVKKIIEIKDGQS